MRYIFYATNKNITHIKPITKIRIMSNSSINYFIQKDIATIKAIPLEELLLELKKLDSRHDDGLKDGHTCAEERMDDFIEKEAKAFLSLRNGEPSAKKMPISNALGSDKVKKGKIFVHALFNDGDWDDKGDTDDNVFGEPLRRWFRDFFVKWFYCVVSRWNVINGLNSGFEFAGNFAVEWGMREVESMVRYCIETFPFQLEGNKLNKEGEADGLGCTIVRTNKGKAVQCKLPGFNGTMFDVRSGKSYLFANIASQIARLITVNGKPLNVIITVDGGRGNNIGQSNTLTIRGDANVIKKYANDREKRRTIISRDWHGYNFTYKFVAKYADSSSGSSKRKGAPVPELTDEVQDVTEEMREREKEKRERAEQNSIVLDGAGSNSNLAKRRKVTTTTTTTTTSASTGLTGSTGATPASAQWTREQLIEKVLRSGKYKPNMNGDVYAVVTSGEHNGEVFYADDREQIHDIPDDYPADFGAYKVISQKMVDDFLFATVLRSGIYYWGHWSMYAVVTSDGEHNGKVCTANINTQQVYDPPAANLNYAFVSREQVKEFLETLRECRVYQGVGVYRGTPLAVSACVFEGIVFYDTLKIHVEEKVYFPSEGHGRFLSSFLDDQKRFIQKKQYCEKNILADPQIFFLLQVQQKNELLYFLKQNSTSQWQQNYTSGLMMVQVLADSNLHAEQARKYVWHNASTNLKELEDATEEFGGSVKNAIEHFKKVKESTRIVRVFSKSQKWFANVSAGQRTGNFKELE